MEEDAAAPARERARDLHADLHRIGERAHLAHKDIDLETHIRDILGVIEYENLLNVILVGHSYGGMVATGVADRATDHIAHLVYVDAFAPRDGQSLLDLQPEDARQRYLAGASRRARDGAYRPTPRRPTRVPKTSPG